MSMMNKPKNPFIVRNDAFTCLNCGQHNPQAVKTCRNHCRTCLFSLHVDLNGPGDRLNCCHGLMKPVAVEKNGKKDYLLIHTCQKCGKQVKNKIAKDDDFEALCRIQEQTALQ